MDDTTVVRGEDVDVFGQGFEGDSDIDIWLDSTPVFLKTVVADADGSFTTTVRIPTGTTTGAHSIVAMGVDPAGDTLELAVAITVAAAPSPPPTTTVDPVGSAGGSSLGQLLGLLLAVAGSAALSTMYVGRRKPD